MYEVSGQAVGQTRGQAQGLACEISGLTFLAIQIIKKKSVSMLPESDENGLLINSDAWTDSLAHKLAMRERFVELTTDH